MAMIRNLFLLLFCISPIFLSAQSNDSTALIISSDSITEISDFDLLMISMSYSNNKIKYKTLDNNIKMPTYSADFSYYHKSGIWASIDYTNYFQAAETTYETDFSVGYQRTFINFLDIDFNYGYHNFKGDSNYEGISYKNTISGTIGLNSKYASLITDFYYMNGISNNYFLDLSVSLNLDFDDVLFKNDFFMFTPSIVSNFGTDDWIFEDFTMIQMNGRKRFLRNHGYITEKFEYQSFGIFIPFIYSLNNFSISLNWYYNFPSDKLRAINWEDQGGFLISLIYSPIL